MWVRWWLDGETEWDCDCCWERRHSVSLSLWARVSALAFVGFEVRSGMGRRCPVSGTLLGGRS